MQEMECASIYAKIGKACKFESMFSIVVIQERDLGDEYGWKQVHGDVFRPASYPILFASLIGTGYHITCVAMCVILFSIWGHLYTE